MQIPYNSIFNKQYKSLIPATGGKAIISNVNINRKTVDIYFIRNTDTVIQGVPVSDLITITSSLIGKRCKVDIFDEVNSKDMVVAYTY